MNTLVKCQGCGAEKDMTKKEVYPYEEDHIVTDRPIVPFFHLDCTDDQTVDGVTKKVTVCFVCFHNLNPDLWISRRCWESLTPVVPFDQLEP